MSDYGWDSYTEYDRLKSRVVDAAFANLEDSNYYKGSDENVVELLRDAAEAVENE